MEHAGGCQDSLFAFPDWLRQCGEGLRDAVMAKLSICALELGHRMVMYSDLKPHHVTLKGSDEAQKLWKYENN